jgi:hypothetical protein
MMATLRRGHRQRRHGRRQCGPSKSTPGPCRDEETDPGPGASDWTRWHDRGSWTPSPLRDPRPPPPPPRWWRSFARRLQQLAGSTRIKGRLVHIAVPRGSGASADSSQEHEYSGRADWSRFHVKQEAGFVVPRRRDLGELQLGTRRLLRHDSVGSRESASPNRGRGVGLTPELWCRVPDQRSAGHRANAKNEGRAARESVVHDERPADRVTRRERPGAGTTRTHGRRRHGWRYPEAQSPCIQPLLDPVLTPTSDADGAVDCLTEEVGVAVVAGALVDH